MGSAPWHSGSSSRHTRMARRRGQIGHLHQLNIKHQVRLRGNSGMIRSPVRHFPGAIAKLPGDENTPLSAHLHARKALVEARYHAPQTHGEAGRATRRLCLWPAR